MNFFSRDLRDYLVLVLKGLGFQVEMYQEGNRESLKVLEQGK